MGYAERNKYAIEDLNKLIDYKTKRGISETWQSKAYSYLNAFRRASKLPPHPFPSHLTMVDASIKDSNEKICKDLRITPRMAELLNLQTLRLDAEQHRKRRYTANQGRSSRKGYLINCQHHAKQQVAVIQTLLDKGMSKSDIAQHLGISRKHIYHLLNQQKEGTNL
ncbi:MAG TPA: helix-turn-helix domain-containing protein [Bacillaceae bacterium]|nr:helix-turn-helix domain-containing protein [Bacillaceae bacterium]